MSYDWLGKQRPSQIMRSSRTSIIAFCEDHESASIDQGLDPATKALKSRTPTNTSRRHMRKASSMQERLVREEETRLFRDKRRARAVALRQARDQKHCELEMMEEASPVSVAVKKEDATDEPTLSCPVLDALENELLELDQAFQAFHDCDIDITTSQIWEDDSIDNFMNTLELQASCPLCMEEKELLLLECKHAFCIDCLLQQLSARWPGPRVTFGYMNCGLCRVPLSHRDLDSVVAQHESYREKVHGVALRQFCDDGLDAELGDSLGHSPTQQELRDSAQDKMVVYECRVCIEPYCGGRVDCAAQQDVVAEDLCCRGCEWAQQATSDDHRCMLHGHQFAIFKCDSCCAVATWNCAQHHYCERCHRDPWSAKHYPCPGAGLCPLGVPHPPNVEANLETARDADITHKSFVLGCLACLGFDEDGYRPTENAENQFGYNKNLEWRTYASGVELLAALGEAEVRGRLRLKAPEAPQGGSAIECAERLLLREQDWPSPVVLLSAIGGASVGGPVLAERLESVGLPSGGTAIEQARRLLLLRAVSVRAMLWAAASGAPAGIAAALRCLPVGQGNVSQFQESCPTVLSQHQECIMELPWGRWQCRNHTFTVKQTSVVTSREPTNAQKRQMRSFNEQTNSTVAVRVREQGQRASGLTRQWARKHKREATL